MRRQVAGGKIAAKEGWYLFKMFRIFVIMSKKSKSVAKDTTLLREEILKSMVASFKIEGIKISANEAAASLKRVSLSLEK